MHYFYVKIFTTLIDEWLASKDERWNFNGIHQLPKIWREVIDNAGQYFDYWIHSVFYLDIFSLKKQWFHMTTPITFKKFIIILKITHMRKVLRLIFNVRNEVVLHLPCNFIYALRLRHWIFFLLMTHWNSCI